MTIRKLQLHVGQKVKAPVYSKIGLVVENSVPSSSVYNHLQHLSNGAAVANETLAVCTVQALSKRWQSFLAKLGIYVVPELFDAEYLSKLGLVYVVVAKGQDAEYEGDNVEVLEGSSLYEDSLVRKDSPIKVLETIKNPTELQGDGVYQSFTLRRQGTPLNQPSLPLTMPQDLTDAFEFEVPDFGGDSE